MANDAEAEDATATEDTMSEGPTTPPSGGQPPPGGEGQSPPGDQPSPQPPGPQPPGPQPPGPQPPGPQPPPRAPGPPTAPAPPPGPSGAGQPADLTTRLLARLIDGILLSIINFFLVVTVVFGAVFSAATGGFLGSGFSVPGIIGSTISAAIYIAYFAYLESSRGQTLGKMLLKVEVRGPDGRHPTIEQAVRRNLWLALTIIPVLGGLLVLAAMVYIIVTISSSRTGQGWHDEFAGGTSVVKLA